MKHKKVKLSVVLLVLGLTLHAQETMVATGGDAIGSGGAASYSIGQLVYTTHSGSNGTVAEGVQQPFEISSTLGIEDLINLELVAYPNPTTGFLTLKVGDTEDFSTLNLQLIDMRGRVIESRKLENTSETIQMRHLPSAMYFLKITNNNRVKTFKIIKN